jgi:hypothetical protein
MVVVAALESLAGWPGYSAVRTVDIQSSLQNLMVSDPSQDLSAIFLFLLAKMEDYHSDGLAYSRLVMIRVLSV